MRSEQEIIQMADANQITAFAAAIHQEANFGLTDDNYGVAVSSAGIRMMLEQWTAAIRAKAEATP